MDCKAYIKLLVLCTVAPINLLDWDNLHAGFRRRTLHEYLRTKQIQDINLAIWLAPWTSARTTRVQP